MSFPVIIIFLELLLFCLVLLRLLYLESDLGNVYDMVILLSLCALVVMTFIVVSIIVLVSYGVML